MFYMQEKDMYVRLVVREVDDFKLTLSYVQGENT